MVEPSEKPPDKQSAGEKQTACSDHSSGAELRARHNKEGISPPEEGMDHQNQFALASGVTDVGRGTSEANQATDATNIGPGSNVQVVRECRKCEKCQ